MLEPVLRGLSHKLIITSHDDHHLVYWSCVEQAERSCDLVVITSTDFTSHDMDFLAGFGLDWCNRYVLEPVGHEKILEHNVYNPVGVLTCRNFYIDNNLEKQSSMIL
jgi:hypothetical protein